MFLTIRGLVLRIADYNDRDALITLLTEEHGRLTVKAKGLRRKHSRLAAPCQLLAYGEFSLFEYKGRYTVNEAYCLELFHGLRADVTKLSLATYFAQVADVLSQEDVPSPELLSLTLNCLYALSKLTEPEAKIKSVFEWRCACISGFFPDLLGCHVCGHAQPDRFDTAEGYLICTGCTGMVSGGIRMPVSQGMLAALRYIAFCEPGRILAFDVSPATLSQLSSLTELYLTTQLERGFKTLDFYKSLFI